MSKVISLDQTENLYCPKCGAEIALEIIPCMHLSFIYIEETRELYYASDKSYKTGKKILQTNNIREEEYFGNDSIATPRIKDILLSALGQSSNSIIFEVENAESVSGISFSNVPVIQSIYYGFEF